MRYLGKKVFDNKFDDFCKIFHNFAIENIYYIPQ